MELSGTGVWSGALRYGDRGDINEAAAELEGLGYSAIWVPGGAGGDIFGDCSALLEATERVTVATGILNIWMHEAQEVADRTRGVDRGAPGTIPPRSRCEPLRAGRPRQKRGVTASRWR